jgi:hypothetical protein
MRPIRDALELLTAQHEDIEFLVVQVQQTYDSDAFDELADKLVSHLALEQELFYPAIACAMTADIRRELLEEHLAIKRVLAELVWLGVEDHDFGAKLRELTYLLDGHCGYQEDSLFEAVAEAMPSDQLANLCAQLESFDLGPTAKAA